MRLRDDAGTEQVVLAGYLMAAPDFQVLGALPLPSVEPVGLLDALPDEVRAEARRWEQHIVEVETGLPANAPPGTVHFGSQVAALIIRSHQADRTRPNRLLGRACAPD